MFLTHGSKAYHDMANADTHVGIGGLDASIQFSGEQSRPEVCLLPVVYKVGSLTCHRMQVTALTILLLLCVHLLIVTLLVRPQSNDTQS
jgi:hypothetical protein